MARASSALIYAQDCAYRIKLHYCMESPTMYRPNFCAECGERLARSGWRLWVEGWAGPSMCVDCSRRLGRRGFVRPIAIISIAAISAFAFGRYLRPAPPPLIISRAANSPLPDLPVNLSDNRTTARQEIGAASQNAAALSQSADGPAYICGARTKKGTPCHRRVHAAGERCFQHKGMPAILPLDKLEVKSK